MRPACQSSLVQTELRFARNAEDNKMCFNPWYIGGRKGTGRPFIAQMVQLEQMTKNRAAVLERVGPKIKSDFRSSGSTY